MKRTCENCEKRWRKDTKAKGCQVLIKILDGECWAWTDDPAWEVKLALKVNRYSGDEIYKNIDKMVKTRPILKSLLQEIA